MMNKKVLYLSLAAMLLPAVFLMVSPEYGTDYSERQRKLWNAAVGESSSDTGYIFSADSLEELQEHFNRLGAIGLSGKEENLKWDVILTERPDLSAMPLNGLTDGELVNIAHGNAGICMELARRYACRFSPVLVGDGLEISEGLLRNACAMWEARSWLVNASEAGRPGVSVLIDMINGFFDEQVYESMYPGAYFKKTFDEHPAGDTLTGLMKAGDYEVFSILRALGCSSVQAPLEHYVEYGLEQPGRAGLSKRDVLLKQFDMFGQGGFVVVEDMFPVHGKWTAWVSDVLKKQGFVSRRKTRNPVVIEALDMLERIRQQGSEGDLESMSVWLELRTLHINYYDREQWDSIFRFARELLRGGHAGFMECFLERRMISEDILSNYYSRASVNALRDRMAGSLYDRGSHQGIALRAESFEWQTESERVSVELLENMIRLNPVALYLGGRWRVILDSSPYEPVRNMLLAYLEAMSASGHPSARQALEARGEE